ncbi:MAG: acyl carrier protein [Muribaculaceae bacterium]|nr:acyl carrier protein [Muribaculaceae bacterium]
MTIKDFIEKFAEAAEIEDAAALTGATEFRELDEWNSLAALSVISMFEEELDKELPVTEFKKARTIDDLFALAQ